MIRQNLKRGNLDTARNLLLRAGIVYEKRRVDRPSRVERKRPRCRVVPMDRFELSTSPLPRECSTPEPHGRKQEMERVKGIEPSH